MIIRPSTTSDVPKIINLLKLSLGESLMPKSEEYWNWKHVQNPFGSSPVLVAEEDGQLIGVRAFMRWEWQCGNQKLEAVRAVDTATHPDHQGKGIFKKLTIALLDYCEREGIDFVFNTPNGKSKPGYLKMGWQSAGKLPVRLTFVRPFSMIKNRLINKPPVEFLKLEKRNEFELADQLKEIFFADENQTSWITAKDLNFIRWRYLNVPVVTYYGCARQKGLVIFRLKQNILGVELRIVEALGDEKQIMEALHHIYTKVAFDYMSSSGKIALRLRAFAVNSWGWLAFTFRSGPEVTVKPVIKKEIDSFLYFKQWDPTLGDLELF